MKLHVKDEGSQNYDVHLDGVKLYNVVEANEEGGWAEVVDKEATEEDRITAVLHGCLVTKVLRGKVELRRAT
jgi:L-rhamnose mutarotase